jgi:hypothetical protein
LFPARETIQPLLEEDTARARGKKSVILALRYFSVTAGDALRDDATLHIAAKKGAREIHSPPPNPPIFTPFTLTSQQEKSIINVMSRLAHDISSCFTLMIIVMHN